MELSELVFFNNRLLSCDDRSGLSMAPGFFFDNPSLRDRSQ